MAVHLREDFQKTIDIKGPQKAESLLDVISKCDPVDANDRMTLYNILGTVGVFEARAIAADFYSVTEFPAVEKNDHASEFRLPRAGGIIPVMTPKQAMATIEFLKEELSKPDRAPVFFFGPYDRGPMHD